MISILSQRERERVRAQISGISPLHEQRSQFNRLIDWIFPLPENPEMALSGNAVRMLNDLICIIMLMMIATISLMWALGSPMNLLNTGIAIGVVALLRLGLSLAYRGWRSQVAFCSGLVLTALGLFFGYRYGSSHVTHLGLIFIAIIFSVMTLHLREAAVLCLLGFAGVLLLNNQELAGNLHSDLVIDAHQQTQVFIAIGVAIFALSLQVRITMARAIAQAEERHNTLEHERLANALHLAQANQELEQKVQQRTAQLQKAAQQLAQTEKLNALGYLLAGVAHEMNTPIGNARVAASTLADGVQDFQQLISEGPIKRKQLERFLQNCSVALELIDRATVRADHLVGTLKQISVDEASLQRAHFDAGKSLTELMNMLTMFDTPITLSLDLQLPMGIKLDSYPGALKQVIGHLFANSLAHGFTGRQSGKLSLSMRVLDDAQIELQYQDNGIGIPPEMESHIFEPFFSTTFGKGGSGLGLYTVHNLVCNLLGGSIEVDGRFGEGALFRLCLPFVSPHIDAKPVPEKSDIPLHLVKVTGMRKAA